MAVEGEEESRTHVPAAGSAGSGSPSRSRHTELRLGPLAEAETTELARALRRGGRLEAGTRELVLSRCSGNPLFVQEVVRSTRAAAGSGIPEPLQGLVQARVDRLEPAHRKLLMRAAVAGPRSAEELLVATGEPETEVATSLRGLEAAGFVHLEQESPPRQYAFDHELIREAVYQSVPPSERGAEHLRIGEALEGLHRSNLAPRYAELAHHFDAGGSALKAAQYLVAAGEEAARASLWDEAEPCLDRALERTARARRDPASEPELADFAERQARANHDWGAVAHAAALRGRDLLRAAGDLEGALQCLEQNIERYRRMGNPFMVARTCQELASVALHLGRPERAASYLDQAAAETGDLGSGMAAIDRCLHASIELARRRWHQAAIELGKRGSAKTIGTTGEPRRRIP